MPEGHTIHRAARLQRRRFRGEALAVDSPQGRFAGGAARLDGQVLIEVEALGKHLLYRWTSGDTLHVHLGLFGRFRTWSSGAPEPTVGTRLRWVGPSGTLHLSGPTICELIDPEIVLPRTFDQNLLRLHRRFSIGLAMAANEEIGFLGQADFRLGSDFQRLGPF